MIKVLSTGPYLFGAPVHLYEWLRRHPNHYMNADLFLIVYLFDQKNYKPIILLFTQTQQPQPAIHI